MRKLILLLVLPHPDHAALGETIGPCLDDVMVIGFVVKKQA
jgi:hypothetical protein